MGKIKSYIFHFIGGGSIMEAVNQQQLDYALHDLNVTDPENEPEPLVTESGKIIILNNVTYIEPAGAQMIEQYIKLNTTAQSRPP